MFAKAPMPAACPPQVVAKGKMAMPTSGDAESNLGKMRAASQAPDATKPHAAYKASRFVPTAGKAPAAALVPMPM